MARTPLRCTVTCTIPLEDLAIPAVEKSHRYSGLDRVKSKHDLIFIQEKVERGTQVELGTRVELARDGPSPEAEAGVITIPQDVA